MDSDESEDQSQMLTEAELGLKKTVLFDFFDYRRTESAGVIRRDARCKKCKAYFKGSKLDREFKHAYQCHRTDSDKVALLNQSLPREKISLYSNPVDKKAHRNCW